MHGDSLSGKAYPSTTGRELAVACDAVGSQGGLVLLLLLLQLRLGRVRAGADVRACGGDEANTNLVAVLSLSLPRAY